MKQCSTCKETKELSEFYKFKIGKLGVQSKCKECMKTYSREYKRKPSEVDKAKRKRKESKLKDPRTHLIAYAKQRAKRNALPFDLCKEDIELPKVCPVLGIPLKVSEGFFTDNSYSLDKLIPELGYVKSNVTVMSMRANRLKGDSTLQELEALVKWIKEQSG